MILADSKLRAVQDESADGGFGDCITMIIPSMVSDASHDYMAGQVRNKTGRNLSASERNCDFLRHSFTRFFLELSLTSEPAIMSILETPIEQSRQVSGSPSTLEYRTALNAIQAGYCDERHNWVLNELLDLCRGGASDTEIFNHIKPYDCVSPGQVVAIIRTLVRAERIKAADSEIVASQSSGLPLNSVTMVRAVQSATEIAAESWSRYHLYHSLKSLNISPLFAASLAGIPQLRRQFRNRLIGYLVLSVLGTGVGLAMLATQSELGMPALFWNIISLRYLCQSLLDACRTLFIPSPPMQLDQYAAKS